MLLTQPDPFITYQELATHLNKSQISPGLQAELELHAATACEVIRDRMGEVASVSATETFTPGTRTGAVVLTHRPVISVEQVSYSSGGIDVILPPYSAGPPIVDGWLLESSEGVLRHFPRWPISFTVLYTAGRDPIPANFRLAALELAAHLWKGSQQNSQGGRPQIGQDGVLVPGQSWALPYSVRQLLGLDKRPRQEVWIG